MTKITDEQVSILRLYARSKKDAEGWADVSDAVWPLVEDHASPDLFEVNGRRIRVTDAGSNILEFAL